MYYGKEINAQKAKIERMKKDEKYDEFDVRKQVQVLEETEDMVPKVEAQLRDAKKELRVFMVRNIACDRAFRSSRYDTLTLAP